MSDQNDEAEKIRRRMQDVRQEMGDELKGIVLGARQLSDWRYYVRQHPWACVGAAFAAGFLLMPGKRSPAQAEVQKLLAELRKNTKNVASLGAGGSLGASMLGRIAGVAAPIALRAASNLFAQKFGGGRPAAEAAEHVHSHGDEL